MNSFYLAGKAVRRVAISFVLALLCALLAVVRPVHGTAGDNFVYLMLAASGTLLLVSIFSLISVALRYLEGCQNQLDLLDKILDHLPDKSNYDN